MPAVDPALQASGPVDEEEPLDLGDDEDYVSLEEDEAE